jgi:hypothetical protein
LLAGRFAAYSDNHEANRVTQPGRHIITFLEEPKDRFIDATS